MSFVLIIKNDECDGLRVDDFRRKAWVYWLLASLLGYFEILWPAKHSRLPHWEARRGTFEVRPFASWNLNRPCYQKL